jgi:hypothetical protein
LNQRPVLRDLVDNSVCSWRTGQEFQSGLSTFPKALALIKNGSWEFAQALQLEVARTRVCISGAPLNRLPDAEQEGLTIFQLETVQVALRLGRDVYVDGSIFNKMDEVNQSFLLLHELLHGFIGMNVSQRMTKLRSFVASIHDALMAGRRLSTQDMGLLMEANDIRISSAESGGIVEQMSRYFQVMECRIVTGGDFASDRVNTRDRIVLYQRDKPVLVGGFASSSLSQLFVPLFGNFLLSSFTLNESHKWVFRSINPIGTLAVLQASGNDPKRLSERFNARLILTSTVASVAEALVYNLDCRMKTREAR